MAAVQISKGWFMQRKTILFIILLMSLMAWFPGAQQTILAAEKAVQLTVPECQA